MKQYTLKRLKEEISLSFDLSNFYFDIKNNEITFYHKSTPHKDFVFKTTSIKQGASDILGILIWFYPHLKISPISGLFKYEIECWFRFGDDDKEFLTTTIIAESDEIAKQLAKDTRRNIFKVEIKSKVPYVENK